MNLSPGHILADQYLTPRNLGLSELASAIGVSPQYIQLLIAGDTIIDSDIDNRFHLYFSTPKGYWLNIQDRYIQESPHGSEAV